MFIFSVLTFDRVRVSPKQLEIILAEKLKKEQQQKNVSWHSITKILNAEGPSVRSASQWQHVSLIFMIIKLKLIYDNLIISILKTTEVV